MIELSLLTQAAGPFSEADGRIVFGAVSAFEPYILSTLSGLVSEKSAFQGQSFNVHVPMGY